MQTHPPAGNGRLPVRDYLLALVSTVVAVIIAELCRNSFGLNDLSPIFMLAVLLVASRTRTGPAVASAILCFLGYNFFFFEPRFTFYISGEQSIATIVLFLAAALITGRLASRLAMQVRELRRTNRMVLLRQDLAQKLAAATDTGQISVAARQFFRDAFGANTQLQADAQIAAPAPESVWSLEGGTLHARLGQVELRFERGEIDAGERALLESLAADVAQALLRARLAADLQSERVANETERLRSALLSSVSHDLRTPLAGMLGAAETLESYSAQMSEADRRALLASLSEEGRRLDRYIQNLLDMTRIGHGAMALKRDWIGIDELIGSASGRLQRHQPDVRFLVDIATGLEPIWVHPALVEQALFNVIENAAKFSPPNEPIFIRARTESANAVIEVHDRGPGIPEPERVRIFEMFYSIERGDRGKGGTGLGLAICRGMVGAHGGSVAALPGNGGKGTIIRITLPLLSPAPASAPA